MPPLWKIRREVRRLLIAPFRGTAELVRKLYVRRYYDRVLAKQIVHHPGQVSLTREAAIYLIFPSRGVQASHLRVLREMVVADIAPVVVSNLPLSDADLAEISPLAMRIIQRPNVGYDFGGYRDGVLNLSDQLPELDRLWLLNDSAWMVPQPTSWFSDARALDVDFAAATSNFAMPRVDPDRFREMTWNFDPTHRNFHYASYALGIGSAVLRDPGFLRFWQKLEIRNDKTRTVRRGEIGLSQWMLAHGYSHGATFEVNGLDADLAVMEDDEIHRIAQELVIPESPRLEVQKGIVLKTDPHSATGRADRISLILAAVSRQASGYVLPGYSLRCRGFQFLKKSPLTLSREGSEIMEKVISRIEGEAGAEIAAEAKLLLSKRSSNLPTDG